MTLGGRLEGVENARDYGWWDVAKELEGQVDAYGVDPSDAGQTASFEGLGKGREGLFGVGRHVYGDKGADGVGHWF